MVERGDRKMGFIDFDVDDAEELKSVEPGEYKLEIIRAEIKDTKSGDNRMLQVDFIIVNQPLSKNVTDYLLFPDGSDMKRDNARKLRLKKFAEAFDIDLKSTEDKDMVGHTGWVILGEEPNDQYGPQNRIRSYIATM